MKIIRPKIPDMADWYWSAKNGRNYSSSRNALVWSHDPGLLAFIAQNGAATPWPVDEAGNQTDASLQAVLASYGITVATPFS